MTRLHDFEFDLFHIIISMKYITKGNDKGIHDIVSSHLSGLIMFSFFKKKPALPVIVAIHGFGKRKTDQLIPLKQFFEAKGFEVICPILFDQTNQQDIQPEEWINRAANVVDGFLAQNKEVILVGFSMGGVIASAIASTRNIKKLILLAPAFYYLNMNNITSAVLKQFETTTESIAYDGYIPLPEHFTDTFRTIVDTHRNDISDVKCPILIFHGTEDTTISYSSSVNIIKKISHPYRALILLHEGTHHLLDHELSHKIVLETSLNFIENKL